MIKVKSGSAIMFHYLPGQHHEVAKWHNEVHRPEIQGAVPHVFYSQDFVAPPAYVSAREHASLPMSGGEYLSLYWSDGALDDYTADGRKASQDRRNAGSYHPFQDVVWAARLTALNAYPRAALGYDVNAAPLAPTSGLVLVAEQLSDADALPEFVADLEQGTIRRGLEHGAFSGCFTFSTDNAGVIQMWFVDGADPLESATALRAMRPPRDEVRTVFFGAYQPVVTGQYDVYV
jgi:hypothetical protein